MKEQYLILDSCLPEELIYKYHIDIDDIERLHRIECLFRRDLEIFIIYPKSEDLYNGWGFVDDEYRLRNSIRNYNISKL